MQTILLSQLVLVLLVTVHELGHYLAMKAFNVEVKSFSIGFGPGLTLFRYQGTRFMLTPFLLGGYVLPDQESLGKAVAYKRWIIYAAGPAMGVIAALIPAFFIAKFYNDLSLLESIQASFMLVWKFFSTVVSSVAGFLASLFVNTREVVGNLEMKDAGSVSANYTFMKDATMYKFLEKCLALSVVISVLNLIPIPPLDGGKMALVSYEVVSGTKPPEALEIGLSLVGVLLVLGLFVLAIINDVISLF